MLIKKCKHLIEVVNKQCQVLFGQQMKHWPTLKRWQQPHLQHRATDSFAMGLAVISTVLLLLPFGCVDAVGYSYTRFIGPVAGPERKIFVNDAISSTDGSSQIRGSGAPRFDYVGKPEYEFAYGVEDVDAHILHNRNEMRDGDAVKGVYSLVDPDGALRVVKYTADEINGFQAEVIRNGISSLHGQLQHDYIHSPPSNIIYNNHHNPDYGLQPQAPQAHFKVDRIVEYPSSNKYKSNEVQLIPNEHETLPHRLPVIYHYKKNYNDDDDRDDDRDGNSNYDGRGNETENHQPHYEVHEKPECENQGKQDQRPQYKVHEKPDEGTQKNQDDDIGHKPRHATVASHKKKKQRLDEEDDDDDDDDDEDYDEANDSEEMDDYDDTVHATHNSEESYEYY